MSPPDGLPTVLLAEDLLDVRTVIRVVIEGLGYQVLAVADGKEGLEVFESHPNPIDLAILDVGLPGIRGPELAERLRAIQPSLPILFATGCDDPQDLDRARLERSCILTKPFSVAELSDAVRQLLGS